MENTPVPYFSTSALNNSISSSSSNNNNNNKADGKIREVGVTL
jgi:hypothetical protein